MGAAGSMSAVVGSVLGDEVMRLGSKLSVSISDGAPGVSNSLVAAIGSSVGSLEIDSVGEL